MTVSEDRVFDLMVELVDFASIHGLPRTALALEGALDAFLQDRGLARQALPAPDPVGAPLAVDAPRRAAGLPPRHEAAPDRAGHPLAHPTSGPASGLVSGTVFDWPPPALPPAPPHAPADAVPDPDMPPMAALAVMAASDGPGLETAFRSRRPAPAAATPGAPPRRLHLLPSQRVGV
ncbi:MAG: hypothetical protein MUF73_11950 [Rhodobacteraceae bacterium]|nr:hypothetical protein [Paracoccaceae bacterium]